MSTDLAIREFDTGGAGAPRFRAARRRVRTPGKHIVLFVIVAALMLSVSTSVLQMEHGRRGPDRLRVVTEGGETAVRLEPFLVDLAPNGVGRIAYMRLSAQIVVDDPEAQSAIMRRNMAIRERINFLLRQLSSDDLDGAADMERLKGELLRRVNLMIAPLEAREVVIHEFIVQ